MYRNISYDGFNKKINLWTWDEAGNEIFKEIPYNPYLFIAQKNGAKHKSIFNTPLIKKEFESDFMRKRFVEHSGINKIYYNISPEQQFLIDHFHGIPFEEFVKNPIRIFYLDIEVYSPNEFPEADEAKHPVNLITIYDSIACKFFTWGLGNSYTPTLDNHEYIQCPNERDLIKSFLRYWRKNTPSILTGWNSDSFDIPYIVNRMNSLFGENYANRLSPTGNIWSAERENRFGSPVTEWYIDGISSIDYMKAFQKFSKNERSSWKLDFIANEELNCGKIDLDGISIAELSVANWNKFVDYNVRDVDLIIQLEKKNHYLELARMIGYKGFTKFEKALSTTKVVDGIYANEARKRNQYIPTFKKTKGKKPAGGLVRVPEPGFKKDIVTFDASSLYPNTIITLNASPETKIANYTEDGDSITITTQHGKEFHLKRNEFKKWMKEEKIVRSENNTLFSQSKVGIIPSVLIDIYRDRKKNKDLMFLLEEQASKLHGNSNEYKKLKRRIEELDILQYTLKILMNSIYGTFGTPHSCLYDLDIVNSITLTGQKSNLLASDAVDKYISEKYGITSNTLIGGDTDSIFIGLTDVFEKLGISLTDNNGNITDGAYNLIEEIGGEKNPQNGCITKYLHKWAESELNSINPQFEFKREKICDVGLFLEKKKRYVLHVINSEGIDIPEGNKRWKYTGIEVVSSTIHNDCSDLMKKYIQKIILEQNPDTANKDIREMYIEMSKFDIETLAVNKSVKKIKKYQKKINGVSVGKGVPINSKGAILHNNLIDILNLKNKYEKIKEGDKIKIIYCDKNKYGINSIAFKNKLPKEFDLQMDYDKMYFSNIHKMFMRVFQAVGWQIVDPRSAHSCDLLEVFG